MQGGSQEQGDAIEKIIAQLYPGFCFPEKTVVPVAVRTVVGRIEIEIELVKTAVVNNRCISGLITASPAVQFKRRGWGAFFGNHIDNPPDSAVTVNDGSGSPNNFYFFQLIERD